MTRDELDRAAEMCAGGLGLIPGRPVTIVTREGFNHTGAYQRLLIGWEPFRIIGIVIGPTKGGDISRFLAIPWENVAEIWTDELPATDLPTDSGAS